MHFLVGFPIDDINEFIVNLTVKGIARLNPYCVKQALPVTPNLLIQMAEMMDINKAEDSVFWCLFLFAFFLFARKSNLVPDSKYDLKKGKCLLRKNVQFQK